MRNDTNDTKDALAIFLIIIVFFVIGGFLGFIYGMRETIGKFQKEAISRNYAQYHPQTAEWEWVPNESVVPEPSLSPAN